MALWPRVRAPAARPGHAGREDCGAKTGHAFLCVRDAEACRREEPIGQETAPGKATMPESLTNRNVLFVGGLGRTGGSLLPFMLDGARGVYTPPFEVHIAGVTGADVRASDLNESDVDRIIALTSRLKVLGKEKYLPKPISCKTGKHFTFDTQRYYERYREIVSLGHVNEGNYLAWKISAFFDAIDRPLPEETTWLVAHSGKAMTHDTLHFLEENHVGQYVYSRRDDVAWWRSYSRKFRKVGALKDKKIVLQFLEVKRECDELAERYQRLFPDRYMILDYDELVDRPKEVLERLCKRIGIDLPATHDRNPTFLGIPVPANSSFKELRKKTELVSSSAPRVDEFDPEGDEELSRLCASIESGPAFAETVQQDEFRAAARRIHRHHYVLETFRKQLSKAARVARDARRATDSPDARSGDGRVRDENTESRRAPIA